MIKKLCTAALLAVTLFSTSCLGPNRAFNKLHDWNETATENRWGNEAIFLGLNIVPVYGIAYFADVVILNSIEWWTGDNPMDS